MPFLWDFKFEEAFHALKAHLVQVPVLAYPCYEPTVEEFVLQTDASAVGLGTITGEKWSCDSLCLFTHII